ncbi:MAG: hypothetical protein AB7U30_04510 [Sulfuricellaceae bacterium]|jgi:hypothetical protein
MSMTAAASLPLPDSACPKCALSGAAVGLLGIILLVKVMVFSAPAPVLLPVVEDCDLSREACGVALPDGTQLELGFRPLPLSTAEPFDVELRLADGRVAVATVEITATDPPMGSSRVTLDPVKPGLYRGKTALPVCIAGHGEWLATVELAGKDGIVRIPFRFETGRGGQ